MNDNKLIELDHSDDGMQIINTYFDNKKIHRHLDML